MEKIEKSRKNEKGSITLFVLVEMLFFIVIVFLSYMGVFNKMASQEKDIQKIEAEYNKNSNIEEMERQYQEVVNKMETSML